MPIPRLKIQRRVPVITGSFRPLYSFAQPLFINLGLLAILSLIGFSSVLYAAPIAPDKDITVVNKQAASPLWKQWWDSARDLTKQQNYQEAIRKYQDVLTLKPLIEEAKWELCKVYIEVEDYGEASIVLESLLELDGERIEYLISGGEIALLEGNTEQAVGYFGQALEMDPAGSYADQALSGLAKSLRAQGRGAVAIPLMEQLYQRGGADPELLLDLARLNRAHGLKEKSGHFYLELIKKYRVDADIVSEAADFFEKENKIDIAVPLWAEYLESHPGYLPYHRKLTDYFIDRGERKTALPNVLVLMESEVDRQRYLLLAANIYLFDEGRADKALSYFEQYRREFPDGTDVSYEIENLQIIMADNLLSIVDNSGVWMLWRDLARITPDRIGIYRAMADLLEEHGKENELIEVLQIIIVHEPDDMESLLRLSQIYLKNKSFDQCLLFLNNARDNNNLPPSYHLLHARCEKGLKNDPGVLADLNAYLKVETGDVAIRTEAITLAADLGLIDSLRTLHSEITIESPDPVLLFELEIKYLENLLENQLYSEAEKEIELLENRYSGDSKILHYLGLEKADLYFARGRMFEAEQILREIGTGSSDPIDIYFLLADHALKRKDQDEAMQWLEIAEKYISESTEETDLVRLRSRIFYLNLLVKQLSGRMDEARVSAREYLKKKWSSNKLIGPDVEILLFIGRDYYEHGQYDELLEILKYYQKIFRAEQDIIPLLNLALQEVEQPDDNTPGKDKVPRTNLLSLSEKLDMSELLGHMGYHREALNYLENVLEFMPQSFRARALAAEARMALLDYQPAWTEYHQLHQAVPDEIYFEEQLYRVDYLLGKTSSIIDNALLADATEKGSEEGPGSEILETPVDGLFLARALWSEDRWDDALGVYDDLYFSLGKKISESMTELRKFPEYQALYSQSFWRGVLFSPEDVDSLDVIMTPQSFSDLRGTDAGLITASLYDTYRWYKIIKLERDAKTALNEKEFYQAEKEYQELIDLDQVAAEEAYPDLVTIFNRLGKNREEAEMLEKIKELKRETPVQQEAVEKNVRQRRPHLSIDGKYREEDGRRGFIDITQKYVGIGLNVTPTLSQEAGVWVARNEYGDSKASTLAKSNFIMGRYYAYFNEYLEGNIEFGFEDFDTDGKSYIIYDLMLQGKLGGGVGLYASLNQSPVDDTIDSLEDGVYRRDFDAGLTLEYLPRVFLGIDASFLNYSDDNDGRIFNLWGSYRIFWETSSLDFTYRYEKFENSISNPEYSSKQDNQQSTELNYWSPGNYWKNMVTAEYKQELWPTGRLQSGTSYFSIRYGLGYEKENNFVQAVDMNILLEISRIFLVKGTLASEWSSDYNFQEAYISLAYRW